MMEEGQIVERGTHDELIASGGAYADLYNSQFQGPDVETGVGAAVAAT
jgi:ATP-binding cassette subfamily B protein